VIRRLARAGGGAALLLALSLSPARSSTGSLEVLVKDDGGKPAVDVVVSLIEPGAVVMPSKPTAVMDQQNKAFVPHVLPVTAGTSVSFPNRDNIRHHVYSFSAPKRFELPLYIGTPSTPVLFDKPGVVVLGCNIHDWMVGYIYVLATPYFAKTTADGRARFAEVPAGAYEARVWHPRMRGEAEKTGKPITIAAGDPGQVSFVVALKPDRRPQQRPGPGPGPYDQQQGG
jgi:plastocyanin